MLASDTTKYAYDGDEAAGLSIVEEVDFIPFPSRQAGQFQ